MPLTNKQTKQAKALESLGFYLVGDVDDHLDEYNFDKYFLLKVGSWKFATSPGHCFMDAICGDTLMTWHLEDHKEHSNSSSFIDDRIKEIKKALNSIPSEPLIKKFPEYQQLSLFSEIP
jgi:hypothetical protein